MEAAIVTVSTSLARGDGEDRSGAELAALAAAAGCEIVAHDRVADDRAAIAALLRGYVGSGIPLVFTTGGTGLTADDQTPEATRDVVEREAPGFAEALRAESLRRTPMGMLSRATAGIAGQTLIVNFPGSPRAIGELFPVVADTLPHVVSQLRRERGRPTGH